MNHQISWTTISPTLCPCVWWNMINKKIQKSEILTHFWYILKNLNPFYFALTNCCLFHAICMCDMCVVWKRRVAPQFVIQGSILPQILLQNVGVIHYFFTGPLVITTCEFIQSPMKSLGVWGHFLLEWSQITKIFTLMKLFMTNRVFKTIFKCLMFLSRQNKRPKTS